MSFDWKEFLSLAEELSANAGEAANRTAISRAYYCAFNFAFARAESTVGKKPWDVASHKWCWEQYKRTSNSLCRRLGNAGDRMKRMRVNADYSKTDMPRLNEEVQRILEDARQFLSDLNALDLKYPRP